MATKKLYGSRSQELAAQIVEGIEAGRGHGDMSSLLATARTVLGETAPVKKSLGVSFADIAFGCESVKKAASTPGFATAGGSTVPTPVNYELRENLDAWLRSTSPNFAESGASGLADSAAFVPPSPRELAAAYQKYEGDPAAQAAIRKALGTGNAAPDSGDWSLNIHGTPKSRRMLKALRDAG
jgi:hypothetical protein